MSSKGTGKPIEIMVILADRSLGYDELYAPEDIMSFDILKAALSELQDYNFTYYDNHRELIKHLADNPPAFVLNFCDDGYLNDDALELHIPALLDMLKIAYSGAAPGCLHVCYNKGFVSSIARAAGIPVPEECYIEIDPESCSFSADELEITYPAFIKPRCSDGSCGITEKSLVHTPEDITAYFQEQAGTAEGCNEYIIQEYLPGNEYQVGIIGNIETGYEVLPILEVDYSGLPDGSPKILTSDSKWSPHSIYCEQMAYKPAQIDSDLKEKLVYYSMILFKEFGCRDYVRFDFRISNGGIPKIMDVNPNPCWAHDGKLNIMSKWAGYSYSGMLDRIIKAALLRNKLDCCSEYKP